METVTIILAMVFFGFALGNLISFRQIHHDRMAERQEMRRQRRGW